MKVGVYVGSFDPVHKGHINMVKQLLNRRVVEKVMMVATESYWSKSLDASLNDRLAMLKLYQSKRIIIDEKHNHLVYTYQVLQAVAQDNPDWDLYLIIGDDLIISLDRWQNLDELLKFKIIVLNRTGIDIDQYIHKLPDPKKIIKVNDLIKYDISSSQVRQLIADDQIEGLNNYLDHGIIDYILKMNLYQD